MANIPRKPRGQQKFVFKTLKAITQGDAIIRPHPSNSRTHPRDVKGSVSLKHTEQKKTKPGIMGGGLVLSRVEPDAF